MILGAGGPNPQPFHGDSHERHSKDGNRKGGDHGKTAPEKAREQKHSAQGDKVHLNEIDDTEGVVHHRKSQGDQRVNGSVGDPGKNEL